LIYRLPGSDVLTCEGTLKTHGDAAEEDVDELEEDGDEVMEKDADKVEEDVAAEEGALDTEVADVEISDDEEPAAVAATPLAATTTAKVAICSNNHYPLGIYSLCLQLLTPCNCAHPVMSNSPRVANWMLMAINPSDKANSQESIPLL
jgi:hypothetical protein